MDWKRLLTIIIFVFTLFYCVHRTDDLKSVINYSTLKWTNTQLWLHPNMYIDKIPGYEADTCVLLNNFYYFQQTRVHVICEDKICANTFDHATHVIEIIEDANGSRKIDSCPNYNFIENYSAQVSTRYYARRFRIIPACWTFGDEIRFCSSESSLSLDKFNQSRYSFSDHSFFGGYGRKITDHYSKLYFNDNNKSLTFKASAIWSKICLLGVTSFKFENIILFFIIYILCEEIFASSSSRSKEVQTEGESADSFHNSFENQIDNSVEQNADLIETEFDDHLEDMLQENNANRRPKKSPKINFNKKRIAEQKYLEELNNQMKVKAENFRHYIEGLCTSKMKFEIQSNANNSIVPEMRGHVTNSDKNLDKNESNKILRFDPQAENYNDIIDKTVTHVEKVYQKYHKSNAKMDQHSSYPVYDCRICTKLLQITGKLLSSELNDSKLSIAAVKLLVKANALHLISHEGDNDQALHDRQEFMKSSNFPSKSISFQQRARHKKMGDSFESLVTENSEMLYSSKFAKKSTVGDDSERLLYEIKKSTQEINDYCKKFNYGHIPQLTHSDCSDCPKLTNLTHTVLDKRSKNKEIAISVGRLLEKTNMLHVSGHKKPPINKNQNQRGNVKTNLGGIKVCKSGKHNNPKVSPPSDVTSELFKAVISAVDRLKHEDDSKNLNNLDSGDCRSLSRIIERLKRKTTKHEETSVTKSEEN